MMGNWTINFFLDASVQPGHHSKPLLMVRAEKKSVKGSLH